METASIVASENVQTLIQIEHTYVVPVLLACALVLYYVYSAFGNRAEGLEHIPGPKTVPLFGNLFQLNKNAPHLSFTQWKKEHGNVVKASILMIIADGGHVMLVHGPPEFTVLGQSTLVVNGYDAIRAVLREDAFSGRPFLYRLHLYSEDTGFMAPPISAWRTIRKSTFRGIRAYGPGYARLNRLLSNITEDVVGRMPRGRPFDPQDLIREMMLRTIMAYVFGADAETDGDTMALIRRFAPLAMDVLGPHQDGPLLDVLPALRYANIPVWRSYVQLRATRDEFWAKVKPKLVAAVNHEDPVTVADFLSLSMGDAAFSDDAFYKVALCDLLTAGNQTTTVSAYCLLNLLAQHPAVQERLRAEVLEHLSGCDVVEVQEANTMPYMMATVIELQRYLCVTPVGLPRRNLEPVTLGGLSIPQDTTFLFNLWDLHRDPEFWHDPEVFRPERFLDSAGALLPADHPRRRHVLAFGLGPRICPGEKFSKARMVVLLCFLLKDFRIMEDPEVKVQVSCDPRTFGAKLSIEPTNYRIMLERLHETDREE